MTDEISHDAGRPSRTTGVDPFAEPPTGPTPPPPEDRPPIVLPRTLAFWIIALGGALTDLATKRLAFDWLGLPGPKSTRWVIPDYVAIQTSLNQGALFGMGQGKGWLFVVISVVSLAGILYWLYAREAWRDRLMTVSLGLVTAGILGNLYDRLGLWNRPTDPPEAHGVAVFGAVRDWILFCYGEKYRWPNFNLADSWLVIGAALMVLASFLPARAPEPGGIEKGAWQRPFYRGRSLPEAPENGKQ